MAMITRDLDPQTTMTAPRPSPDQVLLMTCDANGGQCWLKMSKELFAEIAGESWVATLEEGTARLYEQGGPPNSDWALVSAGKEN